jgi:hypothetical protein
MIVTVGSTSKRIPTPTTKEEFSMSKKLLYTVLAGALSISVLAACGEPADENAPVDDPATIDEPAEDLEAQ